MKTIEMQDVFANGKKSIEMKKTEEILTLLGEKITKGDDNLYVGNTAEARKNYEKVLSRLNEIDPCPVIENGFGYQMHSLIEELEKRFSSLFDREFSQIYVVKGEKLNWEDLNEFSSNKETSQIEKLKRNYKINEN